MLIDDANIPQPPIHPLPGLCQRNDPVYINTRKFILSEDNPYYYQGQYAKGVVSRHTPENNVWHLALIMQALTSIDDSEIAEILTILENTHAGTVFYARGVSGKPAQGIPRLGLDGQFVIWGVGLIGCVLNDCIIARDLSA